MIVTFTHSFAESRVSIFTYLVKTRLNKISVSKAAQGLTKITPIKADMGLVTE